MIALFFKKYFVYFKWGAIILVSSGIIYAVYDYSKLREVTQQQEIQNEKLGIIIEDIRNDVIKQQKSIQAIQSQNNLIERNYSSALEEIDELKQLTNKEIIENKPEVRDEINNRMKEIQRAIQCSTGNTTKCGSTE